MDPHIYGILIRVLLCKEDDQWVARALEMDLLGYGDTQEAALSELRESVEAQISFAHQMKDESLLHFAAEKEYFRRWEEAQKNAMQSRILGDKGMTIKIHATAIDITEKDLRSIFKRRFTHNALECA